MQLTRYKYPGPRPISKKNKGLIHRRHKRQAASVKPQASSSWFHGPISKLLKKRATSIKPQATSVKLQATRNKALNLLTLIKFHGSFFKRLDYDEGVQWMSFMEANLMG